MERPSNESRRADGGPADPAGFGSDSRSSPGAGTPASSRASASGERPSSARRRERARVSGREPDRTIGEILRSAGSHATEILEYLKTLLEVRTERAVLGTRRTMRNVALGVIAGITAIALVLCGVLRLAAGSSGAFAALFGERAWAGDLATGVLFLGGLGLGAALFLGAEKRKSLAKAKAKYEQLHRDHRARFGHHASDLGTAARVGPDGAADGRGAPGSGSAPRDPGSAR